MLQQADQPDAGPSRRIVSPEITEDELSHLLIPLTRKELESVSQEWFKTVRRITQRIAELQAERVRNAETADTEDLSEIVDLVKQRAKLLKRFTMVVDSFERKGGDPDLVAELRAYRKAILYEETALASTHALVNSFFVWLARGDGGIAVLQRVVIAIFALFAIVIVARLLRGFSRIWISRFTRFSRLLQNLIVGTLFWLFIVIGLAIVLAAIDVDITPFFAIIGGASFILAFAFQDTLGNLASGVMIMINQPFDEGNYIEVGGVAGTVRKVSIVGTTIATPDNRIIVVPNKNVWGSVIVNASASDERRVDLVFSASYEDPIQEVLDTIAQVLESHPKILKKPAPDIQPKELAASSVNFVCRPWVRAEDYWEVSCDLTQRVKEAFDEKGLSMPYPQHAIHLANKSEKSLENELAIKGSKES